MENFRIQVEVLDMDTVVVRLTEPFGEKRGSGLIIEPKWNPDTDSMEFHLAGFDAAVIQSVERDKTKDHVTLKVF